MNRQDRELYRKKAAEMRRQAARAETSSLGALYSSIADEWEVEAEKIEDALASRESLASNGAARSRDIRSNSTFHNAT